MKAFDAVVCMVTLGVLMGVAGSVAAQQPYPAKLVRVITPYPPGGSADPMARLVAQKLAEKFGQPVIVENRPGGNSIIGTEAAAKAAPDGYTILVVGNTHVAYPNLLPNLPYDAIKDFDAVASIARLRYVLVLSPSVPANTLQEFIALAKAKPGQLNFASSGVGGGLHLGGELFNIMVGTKMQHVPYKGSGPLMTDLISGQVQLSFQTSIAVVNHIKGGKLKAMAITGNTRASALPQVPTFAEAGLPGFEMTGWYGILAPAGTPKEVINRISSDMAVILVMPDVQEYLTRQGFDPFISTPEQFGAQMKADFAKYANIIKTANIKLEN